MDKQPPFTQLVGTMAGIYRLEQLVTQNMLGQLSLRAPMHRIRSTVCAYSASVPGLPQKPVLCC